VFSIAFLALFLGSGCAGKKPKADSSPEAYAPVSAPASVTNNSLIVTLDLASTGKVASVNAAGFVVLNFPLGHMPGRDQHLSLYRRGLKVGEVKITGPQQDDNTVADLVAGTAEIGDEARNR
jgi:hypothetical protein